MTKFYSPTSNSFFDDAIHGTRTVFVEDVKAQATTLKHISKAEEGFHALLDAAEDDDAKATAKSHLNEMAEERRLALLNPPMIEVDNPECRLPSDAVEISAERHAELMQAQADGKTFRPGTDGLPEIAERQVSVEQVLSALRAVRNKALLVSDYIELPSFKKREGAEVQKKWLDYRTGLLGLPDRFQEAMDAGVSSNEMMGRIGEFISQGRPE